MTHEKTAVTNEHLKQNSSSEAADEVRKHRRLEELEEEHAKSRKADAAKTSAPTKK